MTHSINVQGMYDSGRGRDGLGGVWPTDPYDEIFSDMGDVYSAGWSGAPELNGLGAERVFKTGGLTTVDPAYAAKLKMRAPKGSRYRLAPPPGKVIGTRPKLSRVGRRPPHITGAPKRVQRSATRRPPKRRRKPSKAAEMRARARFQKWIQKWNPRIYAQAVAHANREQRAGGLSALHGWWDSFSSKIADLGGKYLQFKTQKEVLDVQMDRARIGLPPLETGQYAPVIRVQHAPTPETTAQITHALGTGMGKLGTPLLIGGAALAVILLMRK